jgi:trimeric autotransporter adhesin
MKKLILGFVFIVAFIFVSNKANACHGLALVNYSATIGGNGITVNGSSDAATCGCGPYYMEVQVSCTSTFTGTSPGCNDPSWNTFPFYRTLLNVATHVPPNWTEQCALEPYTTFFLPFSDLCPGQTYYLRARERICGSGGTAGPWSSVLTFTTPGTFVPLVIDSLVSPNQYICEGDSTSATPYLSGGCNSSTNYVWSPTTGVSNPFIASPNFSPAVTTTYTVTITDVCTNQQMQDTITIYVSTPPSGVGTISPTVSTTSLVVCEGDTISLTLFGGGGSVYQWQSSTGGGVFTNISGATDTTYLAGPMTTSTQYQVLVYSSLGCPGVSSISTVTVVPAPVIGITNDTSLCYGQSLQLLATGGSTYSWTPNTYINSTTSASPTVAPLTSITYYVTVTNAFGCSSSDSVRITSNGLPTVSGISYLADCGKDNGKVQVTTIGGNGTGPYIYSLDGIAFQSDSMFTGLPVGTYTLTIEDSNGCQAQSTPIPLNEQIITVAGFLANGTTEPPANLAPYAVNITNTSSNATNYLWSFGNGENASDDTGKGYQIVYENMGEYEIILIAYDTEPRCSDTAIIKIKVDGLSALQMPNVFSPNGDGQNDIFLPVPFYDAQGKIKNIDGTRNIVEYSCQIFDRWGKKVFETGDINTGWDGKRMNGSVATDGVYYWVVKAKGIDEEVYDLKGNVTLLR